MDFPEARGAGRLIRATSCRLPTEYLDIEDFRHRILDKPGFQGQ
jgi:hypothetical protein